MQSINKHIATKSVADMSNEELIQLLLNENPNVCEPIFTYYYPKLIFFLNGFLKDKEASEDIVQDVFVKLWQQRTELKEINNFNAFLYRCARNEMLNYVKKIYLGTAYLDNEKKNDEPFDNDPEAIAIANEMSEQIKKAVASMPPQRKKIFMLSRHLGISNQEIAIQLNISKRAVENQLTFALRTIREVVLNILIAYLSSR